MLLSGLGTARVYLAAGATDLRKSFDGLAQLVVEKMSQDPQSGSLFVFCNRGRNRLRILYFESSGYWLFSKRLEQGTFNWPASSADPLKWQVTSEELLLLLSGIDLKQLRPRRWYGRSKARRVQRSA
jgi:transposase